MHVDARQIRVLLVNELHAQNQCICFHKGYIISYFVTASKHIFKKNVIMLLSAHDMLRIYDMHKKEWILVSETVFLISYL